MRRASIANELRAELAREVDALSPSDRVELALKLGVESLELLAAQAGISIEEAQRSRDARKQTGRRQSGCVAALLA
jgi:hypothetical protein